jgi:hypothetical protein
MDPVTATLAAVIGILLFAVGFLMGERRARIQETARVHETEPVPAQEPAANPSYPIPQAPSRRTTPGLRSTTGSRHAGGVRIVGPQEAIARALREKDGLVEELVPQQVANDFLAEADQINSNTRRQNNGR